jgi:hypothetical protein
VTNRKSTSAKSRRYRRKRETWARRQKGPRIRSDAIVGADRRGARDVAASLAHRIDTTQDHIVDEHWIQSVALFQRAECLGGEIERGDLMPG